MLADTQKHVCRKSNSRPAWQVHTSDDQGFFCDTSNNCRDAKPETTKKQGLQTCCDEHEHIPFLPNQKGRCSLWEKQSLGASFQEKHSCFQCLKRPNNAHSTRLELGPHQKMRYFLPGRWKTKGPPKKKEKKRELILGKSSRGIDFASLFRFIQARSCGLF